MCKQVIKEFKKCIRVFLYDQFNKNIYCISNRDRQKRGCRKRDRQKQIAKALRNKTYIVVTCNSFNI